MELVLKSFATLVFILWAGGPFIFAIRPIYAAAWWGIPLLFFVHYVENGYQF